jgi:hypothetical protein
LISIPTALFYPTIQIEAIRSRAVYQFVKNYIVNQNSAHRCDGELIWTCVIYFIFSILVATLFYYLRFKNKSAINHSAWVLLLALFLFFQFYILQVPFFIFEVGASYNCEPDGQTGMAVMFSSMWVSVALIPFGIAFDISKF